jgi:hypothetical protein
MLPASEKNVTCAASAILLFGSRARQDHDNASDTDLLYICDEATPRHVSAGRTSMFFYPWHRLLAGAEAGDLFVGHIAYEARPLADPNDQLGKLKAAFRIRPSYQREIDQASDLGWFIIRFPHYLRPSLMAKRMMWCARTILIARLAEQGKLVFAPNELAELANSKSARELLSERRRRRVDEKMNRNFRQFLLTATDRQRWHREESLEFFVRKFAETSNEVATKTIEQNKTFEALPYA